MSEMRAALAAGTARVLTNIRLGLTNDHSKEEAIALFRVAKCILPPWPLPRNNASTPEGRAVIDAAMREGAGTEEDR